MTAPTPRSGGLLASLLAAPALVGTLLAAAHRRALAPARVADGAALFERACLGEMPGFRGSRAAGYRRAADRADRTGRLRRAGGRARGDGRRGRDRCVAVAASGIDGRLAGFGARSIPGPRAGGGAAP